MDEARKTEIELAIILLAVQRLDFNAETRFYDFDISRYGIQSYNGFFLRDDVEYVGLDLNQRMQNNTLFKNYFKGRIIGSDNCEGYINSNSVGYRAGMLSNDMSNAQRKNEMSQDLVWGYFQGLSLVTALSATTGATFNFLSGSGSTTVDAARDIAWKMVDQMYEFPQWNIRNPVTGNLVQNNDNSFDVKCYNYKFEKSGERISGRDLRAGASWDCEKFYILPSPLDGKTQFDNDFGQLLLGVISQSYHGVNFDRVIQFCMEAERQYQN
jgi:hypothetical protein